jgi:hypothetical protein
MTDTHESLIATDDSVAARNGRRIHTVRSQIAECDRDLEALAEERVEGLHGESFTAEAADDLAEQHEDTIRADINRGVLKHTPATKGQLRLARLAPFADFLVFLYFLAVIFNADWAHPLSTPVQGVLALVLASIATAGVAATLRSIAARYRQEKPDDNRFPWRRRTRQTGLQLDRALLVVILVGVGVMMFYRIYTDARASQLGVAASLLVALFFSLITVALNYVIFMVEYTNGSPITDELRHLRAQLEPIEQRTSATKRRRRELEQRLDTLRRNEHGTADGPASPEADRPSRGTRFSANGATPANHALVPDSPSSP